MYCMLLHLDLVGWLLRNLNTFECNNMKTKRQMKVVEAMPFNRQTNDDDVEPKAYRFITIITLLFDICVLK